MAHANGFPTACYGELVQHLSQSFEVIGKPILAHDPDFPVQDGWNTSVEEIIDFIENSTSGPVVGMGHSFGGTITLKAASKRPDLFSHIILLDPVLVVGFIPVGVTDLLKRIGKIGAVTPADKTEGRRRIWQSREEAFNYFAGKALFKDFTERSLQLYVEHGLEKTADGYRLVYDVPTEVQIFRSVPTDLDRLSAQPIKCPGLILRGSKTDVARKPFVKRIAKAHRMAVQTVNGGHMFPFEEPDNTATAIQNWLGS